MRRALAPVGLTVCLGIGVVLLVLIVVGQGSAPPDQTSARWLGLVGGVYLGLGALLVIRRPTFVVPWVLVAFGLCLLASGALTSADFTSPAGFLDRLDANLYVMFGVLIALLVQLFPTGRPVSGWWRWITRSLFIGGAVIIVGQVAGVDVATDPRPWLRVVGFAAAALFAVGIFGSIPMLVVRYHRARGAERAQLKWFLFSIAFLAVGWFAPDESLGTPYRSVTNVASLLPAVAIALALLRYRLYDIDRIVSRTTSYAIVTGFVLATYAAVVTVVLRLLPHSSSFAVAAATLSAAVVVRPLLRRVQRVVDRRFDRTRYDHARTVKVFGDRMRTAVHPDQVVGELLTTVGTSLHPASSALWTPARP